MKLTQFVLGLSLAMVTLSAGADVLVDRDHGRGRDHGRDRDHGRGRDHDRGRGDHGRNDACRVSNKDINYGGCDMDLVGFYKGQIVREGTVVTYRDRKGDNQGYLEYVCRNGSLVFRGGRCH